MRSSSSADLVFPVHGSRLPELHGPALARAVLDILPWLAQEPRAGIINVRGASTGQGELLLSRRATLTLRLPLGRVEAARALGGCELAVGGVKMTLGQAEERPLYAHPALSARWVDMGTADEVGFTAAVLSWLDAFTERAEIVVGPRGVLDFAEGAGTVFNLAVYELRPEEALVLLEQGLGAHRLQGCGVFVPHKSFAAVGH